MSEKALSVIQKKSQYNSYTNVSDTLVRLFTRSNLKEASLDVVFRLIWQSETLAVDNS